MEMIASLYEISRQLGSGGGGTIYLGRHLRLDKNVVLKTDRRTLSQGAMSSLRREAETLKNLSHSNIPQIYDFVIENENVYTVMDFIEGESLDKALDRGERFSSQQIVGWAKQLLEALVYLHTRPPYGILHSDIKPANIMLTPQGDVKLIDFNIALALGEDGAVSVGRSQGYASPEHYGKGYSSSSASKKRKSSSVSETANTAETVDSHGGDNPIVLDARSDIYGLAATLYHLLTGRRPARYASDVIPLTVEDCPLGLAAIINKAMSPDKNLRFQTADKMLAAFMHIHRNDPRSRRYRRLRGVTAIIASVFLLLGAFTVFTGLRRMERTKQSIVLAEESTKALSGGDVQRALSLALEALPAQDNIFIPPYTPQAQKALTNALGIYDLTVGFKPLRTIELPSAPFTIALSPDGNTVAAMYSFETKVSLKVFDIETGEILAILPSINSSLAEVLFMDNSTLVYAGEGGLSVYDINKKQILWTGDPTTAIALAADGNTIASVFKDQNQAVVYSKDGIKKEIIPFGDRYQRVAFNDGFANPQDNLFALNGDGSLLAVSFVDGSLSIFDLRNGKRDAEILDESEYFHFEGGFSGNYFAFSATATDNSLFAAIDMDALEQTAAFELPSKIGVLTNESGVFVSYRDTVVRVNLETGEQQEVAFTDKYVRAFDCDENNALVSTEDEQYHFFKNAERLSGSSGKYSCDFLCIKGDTAIVGNRNSPLIRVMRYENHANSHVFSYDPAFTHDEARINAAGTRVMLFAFDHFQLYDSNGVLLTETIIPDAERVYDQQYSKLSGNLAVIYWDDERIAKDALRIYSGDDGKLLYEKTGLSSVFYAPYGISIFEKDGTMKLVDLDTGTTLETFSAVGDFAAYCGMVVDETFLNGRKLLGAAHINGSYLFAVGNEPSGNNGAVYNGEGKKLFDVDAPGDCAAFFAGNVAVISQIYGHGTPVAYNIKTGQKIRELEKEAYLTYFSHVSGYLISEYITADGDRYGQLLDEAECQILAVLPQLTDIDEIEGTLIFDNKTGNLWHSRIYYIDELINIAHKELSTQGTDK